MFDEDGWAVTGAYRLEWLPLDGGATENGTGGPGTSDEQHGAGRLSVLGDHAREYRLVLMSDIAERHLACADAACCLAGRVGQTAGTWQNADANLDDVALSGAVWRTLRQLLAVTGALQCSARILTYR